MRWIVAVVVVLHGLIHLLGAAKGLGWVEVTQLGNPISTAMGVAWLGAAVLVVVSGVLLLFRVRWWWGAGVVAVAASQAVILTSWGDASAGTVANVVLLAAVIYGCASQGPASYRAEYRRRVDAALSEPHHDSVVTESDLVRLPEPVARYVRRSGAVGKPRVTSFQARIHGRIRAAATTAWMSYTGEQVNTFGAEPSRLFFMDAAMFGVPMDILHTFVGPSATMRVKACSLIPVVSATGPDMDRAETVTLFNDLCLLAPAALIDAPVTWQRVDDHHVRGTFSKGPHTVTAELAFSDDDDLVDFISDDRLRSSSDGKAFTSQRWSTPVRESRTIDSRRVATRGEGRWHPPEPEGEFVYLEFNLDDITYNAGNPPTNGAPKDLRVLLGIAGAPTRSQQ
jgi:hypothetical protein